MSNPFDSLNIVKVATIGMDDRMRELMKMAFQGPGKGSCVLSDIESSDVLIFNMDANDGVAQQKKYSQLYPLRPTIVTALKDPSVPNAIFLEKPFRVEKLLETLNSIRVNKTASAALKSDRVAATIKTDTLDTDEKVNLNQYENEREFCGSNNDVDLSNTESLTSIYYKPSDYLQEQIFYASRISQTDKVAVQIAIKVNDKWELITFLPTLQGVFTTLTDFQLRVVCTAPKYCTEIKIHRYNQEETTILETGPRTKTAVQRADPFLWKVALWTSRGRIPSGTGLSSHIKLNRWPNFTRLETTPNCMRIATLLMDDARPLKVVAKVLNIPQRHVFAFYSACYALGYAINLNTADISNSSIDGKKHKQHSLLGRILRRLTGAVTT